MNDEALRCASCNDLYSDSSAWPCGHSFHQACLRECERERQPCPRCADCEYVPPEHCAEFVFPVDEMGNRLPLHPLGGRVTRKREPVPPPRLVHERVESLVLRSQQD